MSWFQKPPYRILSAESTNHEKSLKPQKIARFRQKRKVGTKANFFTQYRVCGDSRTGKDFVQTNMRPETPFFFIMSNLNL